MIPFDLSFQSALDKEAMTEYEESQIDIDIEEHYRD